MPAAKPRLPIPDSLNKVHDYLVYEHPLVQALGISPETAAKLKIGWKERGVLRGYLVFPLYTEDEHGKPKLVSYFGYNPNKKPPIMFPSGIGKRI